jgi:hypothetical protein
MNHYQNYCHFTAVPLVMQSQYQDSFKADQEPLHMIISLAAAGVTIYKQQY